MERNVYWESFTSLSCGEFSLETRIYFDKINFDELYSNSMKHKSASNNVIQHNAFNRVGKVTL